MGEYSSLLLLLSLFPPYSFPGRKSALRNYFSRSWTVAISGRGPTVGTGQRYCAEVSQAYRIPCSCGCRWKLGYGAGGTPET